MWQPCQVQYSTWWAWSVLDVIFTYIHLSRTLNLMTQDLMDKSLEYPLRIRLWTMSQGRKCFESLIVVSDLKYLHLWQRRRKRLTIWEGGCGRWWWSRLLQWDQQWRTLLGAWGPWGPLDPCWVWQWQVLSGAGGLGRVMAMLEPGEEFLFFYWQNLWVVMIIQQVKIVKSNTKD